MHGISSVIGEYKSIIQVLYKAGCANIAGFQCCYFNY